MKLLRGVKDCVWRNGFHNDVIWNELGMESIQERIKIYLESWRDHVVRMSQDWLPRPAKLYPPQGRLHHRWLPTIYIIWYLFYTISLLTEKNILHYIGKHTRMHTHTHACTYVGVKQFILHHNYSKMKYNTFIVYNLCSLFGKLFN